MKKKIGDIAGQVWELLGEKGDVKLSRLPKMLKLKGRLAYQGLGWLAREDKVVCETRGGKTFVSLTEHERNVYTNIRGMQKSMEEDVEEEADEQEV